MPKHKIEFTLPADLKFSPLVRRISEEVFHYAGFDKEWADRLKLVVDELFMNANRYGSKTDDDKIYMLFIFDNNEVSFRIEDEGRGQRKTNAAELKKLVHKNADKAGDLSKTSGRGLALITHLWTDDMKIEDSKRGGIVVTFTKKISAET
ncbi:MAG: ATP-binding protein [Patescibacteria group bacterium]